MIVGEQGMVAIFAPAADSATWSLWGAVGESFGALNAIFSGLALAALVVTFWLQFKELRSQRMELSLQRESLIQSHQELHRAAEVNIRHLHVDLMKMAIDDPVLAELWPLAHTGLAPECLRQYFYANLMLQHIRRKISSHRLARGDRKRDPLCVRQSDHENVLDGDSAGAVHVARTGLGRDPGSPLSPPMCATDTKRFYRRRDAMTLAHRVQTRPMVAGDDSHREAA